MRARSRELLAALAGAGAGAILPTPPSMEGIAGVTGAPRARGPWDAFVAARAPDLPGDSLTFVALEDGTLVVDDDVPDGSVTPLAEAVESQLDPPYEAAGVRGKDDVWTVAARDVLVAVASPDDGDRAELSRVDGVRTALVDDEDVEIERAPAGLVALLDTAEGDVAITAERLDDTTWVAERWAL